MCFHSLLLLDPLLAAIRRVPHSLTRSLDGAPRCTSKRPPGRTGWNEVLTDVRHRGFMNGKARRQLQRALEGNTNVVNELARQGRGHGSEAHPGQGFLHRCLPRVTCTAALASDFPEGMNN